MSVLVILLLLFWYICDNLKGFNITLCTHTDSKDREREREEKRERMRIVMHVRVRMYIVGIMGF